MAGLLSWGDYVSVKGPRVGGVSLVARGNHPGRVAFFLLRLETIARIKLLFYFPVILVGMLGYCVTMRGDYLTLISRDFSR